MNTITRSFAAIACIFFSPALFAQTGSIKGNVKDGKTQEGVLGANIYISGTTQGSVADFNGDFEISKVKGGTYDLIVSFISYKVDTIKGVLVYPDQTTVVNTLLFEETQELEGVVVTGERITNTDVSVITEIKKADVVLVGISAQQISLSQDRDAAQVIRRVPGITIFNNKFVNVRGLSERYNTVMLNGIIAPSTEVDSRAFAFDLIPSSMIDRMMVFKSGSPEIPAEMSGAVINVETKSVVDEDLLSVSLGTGIRLGTTFNDFSTYEGSDTDWLGFDNKVRPLPSGFPSGTIAALGETAAGREQLVQLSKDLPNNWGLSDIKASPDFRANINFARASQLGKMKLSNITSIGYTSTFQHINQNNYYYDAYDAAVQKSNRRYYFNDNKDAHSVRGSVISNFIFQVNPNHRIQFNNLFNQQGTSAVTSRTGTEDIQGFDVYNRALNYNSRQLYAGQLSGKHSLNDAFSANWILGYSSTGARQPDYRRIRSQRGIGDMESDFRVVIPPTSSTFDAGRFFSDLTERTYTNALNFELKLNPSAEEGRIHKLLFGSYLSKTTRSFDARWFAYKWASLSNQPLEVLNSSFETIFAPENIGYSTAPGQGPYFVIDEGTTGPDQYSAENLLAAGYVGGILPLSEKYRLSAGARLENNRQQLFSMDGRFDPTVVDNPIVKILPYLNLSYSLSEKSLFRVAYSKTLNRPIFRELANFNYYDFDLNANFTGNSSLKTADIHNADVRWEYYPGNAELISVGVFYKYFHNPIENFFVGGSNRNYRFDNAYSARNYGIEAEVRKSLAGLSNSAFIDRTSLIFNGALIHSQIQLSEEGESIGIQESDRALQGQSPFILNAGINYNDYEAGLQVNLSYNVIGKRIFAVGDLLGNATQYEMPRNQVDFTVSKRVRNKWEVKLGIQDIFNQEYRILQDSDGDKQIDGIDEPIQTFRPGSYMTFSLTYRVR